MPLWGQELPGPHELKALMRLIGDHVPGALMPLSHTAIWRACFRALGHAGLGNSLAEMKKRGRVAHTACT